MIKEVLDLEEKEEIARLILNDLHKWFGIDDIRESYIEKSLNMPFLAYYHLGKPIGFIVLHETSEFTAEIFVMGVLKEYQRKGIGRALFRSFEKISKSAGYSYLQVKTVETGRYFHYDLTNKFYKEMGFVELECFPDMWDKWNPCQIYIKYIG